MLLSLMTLSGCSKSYTVDVPDEYIQDTPYPSTPPTTFGECVREAIPDWKAALDSANADKKAIRDYKKEMK